MANILKIGGGICTCGLQKNFRTSRMVLEILRDVEYL